MQAPPPPAGHENHIMGLYTNNHGPRPAKKTSRVLPTAPERVLDAPDLVDDYYLNLLDWGANNSVSSASSCQNRAPSGLCACGLHLRAVICIIAHAWTDSISSWTAYKGQSNKQNNCRLAQLSVIETGPHGGWPTRRVYRWGHQTNTSIVYQHMSCLQRPLRVLLGPSMLFSKPGPTMIPLQYHVQPLQSPVS